MIKKEVLIGFFTGILANLLGMFLYILLFSDLNIIQSLEEALKEDFLGTLITAGAVLNFFPFFLFLRKGMTYRARGVLLATILAALCIVIIKII